MKEKVMQGKPYAGNPHVRFDEGAGAPRHSGRSALLYIIGAAAVAVGATLPANAAWSSDVYTQTTNGATWRFKIDTDSGRAMLGTITGTSYASGGLATSGTITGNWTLPETLEADGVQYTVTDLGRGCFEGYSELTSLVLPNIYFFRRYVFNNCKALKSLWLKGPNKASSGSQTYVSLATDGNNAVTSCFNGCSGLKTVLVGPYLEHSTAPQFAVAATDCVLFLPRSSGHTTWNSYTMGGSGTVRQFYGPTEDLDLEIDETKGTIAATVSSASALTNVLNAVASFRDDFGLAPSINVTNVIEVGAGLVTADNAQYLAKSFSSLVFKVTTQSQLRTLLDNIPSSVPFAINPADSKEELTVDAGRVVYVRLSAEGRQGKYTPKIKGMVIIVR